LAKSLLFSVLSNVTSLVAAAESDLVATSIGSGLYVSLLGSLLAFIGGLTRIPEDRIKNTVNTQNSEIVESTES
jgi:hypothetical protein